MWAKASICPPSEPAREAEGSRSATPIVHISTGLSGIFAAAVR
jgi:hypothetical protein